MKNISKKKINEALFTGQVIYDKNPDKPMYYFQFQCENYKVFIGLDSIFDYLYNGIEKKLLPSSLFSWLVDNNEIIG